MNAGNVNGHNSRHLDDNNNNNGNSTGTQAPDGRVHAAVAADQADWALAAVPDGLNATGLLAEDLEDYAGGGKSKIELFSFRRSQRSNPADLLRFNAEIVTNNDPLRPGSFPV